MSKYYSKFLEKNARFNIRIARDSTIHKFLIDKQTSINAKITKALSNQLLAEKLTGKTVFDLIIFYQKNKNKS